MSEGLALPGEATVAPVAPGLVADHTRSGNWLFRWRSYPPVLVFLYIAAVVALDPVPDGGMELRPVWVGMGLLFGVLGLLIRGWTVGHVPMGTSGRGTKRLRAETLNREGIYSLVRHPLYLGNFFLWIGIPVFAGKVDALVITTLLFWVYYERIMMAEERYLYERFGSVFGEWASRTRCFIPRFSGWVPWAHPFSLRFALGRDYQAVYGFVATIAAVELVRAGAAGEGWRLSAGWLVWFGAGTVLYFVLHLLKRRTRLLEVGDRG